MNEIQNNAKKLMHLTINFKNFNAQLTLLIYTNHVVAETVTKPVSRGRKEFIAIDEKEFLSVSDLVRGRAKLADVNKV